MTPRTERLIRSIIRKYRVSCWWVDTEELYQQALLLYQEALPHYDDLFGEEHSYMYRPVAQGLARYIRAQSSPVTAPTGMGQTSTDLIRNLHRADFDERDNGTKTTAFDLYVKEELRERVRVAVWQAVQETKFGELAYPVLLCDVDPADVARSKNVDVVRVHRAVTQVRKRLREDHNFGRLKEFLR